jgi:hypothetical protein
VRTPVATLAGRPLAARDLYPRTGWSGTIIDAVAAAALVLRDPAVHRTLVREHGWTRAEYADWIWRAAAAELLEGDDAEGTTGPRDKR